VLGILLPGSVDGGIPGMRCIFGAGRSRMIEALEGTLYVSRHRQINVSGAGVVVPVQGKPDVALAGPIRGADVFLFDDLDEGVYLHLAGVADSEIIHHEGEH
jgi:hypothetical protein